MSTFSLEASSDHFKYWRPFPDLPAKHSAKTSACPCQPLAWRPTLTTWKTDDRSWSCQQNTARRFQHVHVNLSPRGQHCIPLEIFTTVPVVSKKTVWRFQHVHVNLQPGGQHWPLEILTTVSGVASKTQREDFSMSTSAFHREANADHLKYWQRLLELPAKRSTKISAPLCLNLSSRMQHRSLKIVGNHSWSFRRKPLQNLSVRPCQAVVKN